MLQEDKKFLSYFITEPVYLVRESRPKPSDPAVSEEKKTPVVQKSAESEKSPALPIFPYQGKNLKKVLVLFHHASEEKLAQKEEIFLGKILHAVNLNFDDVALLNINLIKHEEYTHLTHFDAKVWLSFGVKSEKLAFKPTTTPYEIITDSGVRYLLADPLEEIQQEKDKKVKLWNNLKLLFNQ